VVDVSPYAWWQRLPFQVTGTEGRRLPEGDRGNLPCPCSTQSGAPTPPHAGKSVGSLPLLLLLLARFSRLAQSLKADPRNSLSSEKLLVALLLLVRYNLQVQSQMFPSKILMFYFFTNKKFCFKFSYFVTDIYPFCGVFNHVRPN
jgi:hypothetical protein